MLRYKKILTFSLASLMQFWNNSRIWRLSRKILWSSRGSILVAIDLRRFAAARAALAWARSSWSSLEPRKKGLVGDCNWEAIGRLCFCTIDGLGLRGSAIGRIKHGKKLEKDWVGKLFQKLELERQTRFSLHFSISNLPVQRDTSPFPNNYSCLFILFLSLFFLLSWFFL